jgi:hypothetical protein
MSLIKLSKSSSKLSACLFIFTFFFNSFTLAEEKPVDIWANENNDIKKEKVNKTEKDLEKSKIDLQKIENKKREDIKISDAQDISEDIKLIGLYEPEKNDFSLDMWSKTDGELIGSAIKRIEKIKLSKFSEDIFLNTILTYSYPPQKNLSENEFLKLKIDWLIKNNKIDLIENFLNNNLEFDGKSKLISEVCKKIDFISKEIKDNYLEKFRIYCLILNKKKEEAQINLDLLREEGRSDKFFDDKILFLLGLKDQSTNKIFDNNLLNFYLSSITIEGFNYEPTKKTDKNIWKYMVASNLIVIDKIEDPEKIKKYEAAANDGTFDKDKIFEIYLSKL